MSKDRIETHCSLLSPQASKASVAQPPAWGPCSTPAAGWERFKEATAGGGCATIGSATIGWAVDGDPLKGSLNRATPPAPWQRPRHVA